MATVLTVSKILTTFRRLGRDSSNTMARRRLYKIYLVKNDSSLDCALVAHGLQTFGPLFELECLVDDSVDLDLSAV